MSLKNPLRKPSLRAMKLFRQAACNLSIVGIKEFLEKYGTTFIDSTCNRFGDTALMYAACAGHTHLLEFLLNNGASIDQKNWNGYTALMLAIEAGRKDTVLFLLDRGASLDEKNCYGTTALMMATKKANDGRDMVMLLDKNTSTANPDKLHPPTTEKRETDTANELSRIFSKTAKLEFRVNLSLLERTRFITDATFASTIDKAVNLFGIEESKLRQAFTLSKSTVNRWIQQQNLPQPQVRPKIFRWIRDNLQ